MVHSLQLFISATGKTKKIFKKLFYTATCTALSLVVFSLINVRTHSLDVRKHSNIDDGISKSGEKHGEVSNIERSDSFLSLIWTLQITTLYSSFFSLDIGL